MPQQTKAGVTKDAIDLRPPRAAVIGDQWYLVDEGASTQTWRRGSDLLKVPAPVKVSAIAWRV